MKKMVKWIVALSLGATLPLSTACAGSTQSAQANPAEEVALGEAVKTDPTWQVEDLNAVLVDSITKKVKADLERGAPWFELDKLPEYAKDPTTLPQKINGRASDALWLYLPVIVHQGDLEYAKQVLLLLRNADANLNPKVVYQGSLTLSEVERQLAGKDLDAQKAAIKGVLGALAPKRFFRATRTLATLIPASENEQGDLPQYYRSSIENMMTYPMTPDAASDYLYIQHLSAGIWQNLDAYKPVYSDLMKEAKAAEKLPYRFTNFNMEERAADANPVVIGIFDSGVASLRYNMYQNPGEQPNGLDDDENGLIDDLSGIVWDWDPATRHQHSNLDQVEKLPPDLVQEYETYIIGAFDRNNGMDTEASKAFNTKVASLSSADDQKDFRFNMSRIGEWAHGTHVAGLATAGNRWASVASFRFSWTGESRIYHERGPSDQELRWERESVEEMIEWVNAHDVRVVNASLGFTVEYQEAQLAKERDVFQPELPAYGKRNADGKLTAELDLDRIHERAVLIQEFRREIWRDLFNGCPNTLFVLSAGNSDHDIKEFETVPNTIEVDHDNLLIVGAVDDEGEWSSFTNFNEELVKVYDFGVNVLSHSPTGKMIPMSGTSMSAPNATNLAGKLLSLYPELTPAQTKAVIIESADPIPAPFHGGIVDEVKAVELADKRYKK